MISKNIMIQIGFVAITIPLLTLLFHFLAQEIAPTFHSGVVNYLETGTGMNKYQIERYRLFSLYSILIGVVSGIIVGRAAYYLYRDR